MCQSRNNVKREMNFREFGAPLALFYKTYEQEKYAKMFAHEGRFRMNTLTFYRTIEDKNRCDNSEGRLLTVDSRGTRHQRMHENQKFLFCVSGPDIEIDYQREQFGAYTVRINDPSQFISDLDEYLVKSDYFVSLIRRECGPVRYGILRESEYGFMGRSLVYFNKPQIYSRDCEYRIVLVGNISALDIPFLDINLGRKIRYAELL